MLRSFQQHLRWLALCGLIMLPGVLYGGEEFNFSMTQDEVPAGEPAVVTASAKAISELLTDVDDEDQVDEGSAATKTIAEPAAIKKYSSSNYGNGALGNTNDSSYDSPSSIPSGNLTGSPSGNSCCNLTCDPCCRPGCYTPFLGVAATFLAPIHNSASSGTVTGTDLIGGTVLTSSTSTAGGMIVSPRLWLGFVGPNGWGAAVRYWRYSNIQSGLGPLGTAGAGTFLSNTAQLQLQTLDMEVIRALRNPSVNPIWFSIGARYAQFQNYTGAGFVESMAGPSLASGSAFSGSDFYGLGLTTSLYGKRKLGNASPWSFFWGGRLSMLWDNSGKSFASTSANTSGALSTGLASSAQFASGVNDLFIFDTQTGLQYDRALRYVPRMNAFFRVAYEWQYWTLGANGIGAHATSTSTVTAAGVPTQSVTAVSQAGGAVLDLIGFNIATGFYW